MCQNMNKIFCWTGEKLVTCDKKDPVGIAHGVLCC